MADDRRGAGYAHLAPILPMTYVTVNEKNAMIERSRAAAGGPRAAYVLRSVWMPVLGLAAASALAIGVPTSYGGGMAATLGVFSVAVLIARAVAHRMSRAEADIEQTARALTAQALAGFATPAQLQTALRALEEATGHFHTVKRLGFPMPRAAYELRSSTTLIAEALTCALPAPANQRLACQPAGTAGEQAGHEGALARGPVRFQGNSTR
jgi:hypothetical protein